ncbi:hypothetical protein [Auritidibacter ignavus]|uniref:hypothetical protein n=1 Tax=Auritidibacter ignavus TaxID=678932 RepID=UPI002FE57EDB
MNSNRRAVNAGDVVLLGAGVFCGSDPESQILTSTVYIDPDYAPDQLYWQYVNVIRDRLDTQDFADIIYANPAQVLHLGEGRVGLLMPWVDEIVKLSLDPHGFSLHAHRMHVLWFSILDVVVLFVQVTPVRISPG